jgi:alanine racemase
MFRPTKAFINVNAIRHNFHLIKRAAQTSKIFAVIKADGYGHGMIRVAQQLSDADGFAVSSIDEALELRSKGFLHRILLLEGIFDRVELPLVLSNRFDIVIHNFQQLQWLEQVNKPLSGLKVWIKLNTGMNRLGFDCTEIDHIVSRIDALDDNIHLHFMSHFYAADESELNYVESTREQLKQFLNAAKPFQKPMSMANSAGLFNLEGSRLDWVRPGIALYGSKAFCHDPLIQLKPVMRLEAEIIALHDLQKGDTVGYGGSWIAPQNSVVATVSIGYGDGYPRHAPPGTPVSIHKQRASIVGRVSMDMISVDVSNIQTVALGDKVVLWGDDIVSIDEVANKCGTISYELMCSITSRVEKIEEN